MFQLRGKKLLVLIAFVSLAGLGLRSYRLSNQSFWTDEVSCLITARSPLNEIFDRSAELNSLPTYFLLLREVVGSSNENIEARARLISVIAGGLSIPVFIGIVFLWRRDWVVAILAGILLAINPLHLWYSQETRNYALMLFLGSLCLLTFELARARSKGWWWAGYVLFALLATSAHKTGIVFPLICAGWDLGEVARRRLTPRAMAPHTVLALIVVALFLILDRPPPQPLGRSSSLLELGYTGMTFVGGYSFGPSLTEIQNLGPIAAVWQHPVQTGMMAVLLVLAVVICVRGGRSILLGKEMLLIVMGVGTAVLGGIISDFPYNVRYALPALFGFVALMAALSKSGATPKTSQILIMGLLVVNLWADAQWFFAPNYRKGDFRAVARWLTENRQKIKTWIVLPYYLDFTVRWYMDPNTKFDPSTQSTPPSLPVIPDALIITRRHHLQDVDKWIEYYRLMAGDVQAINSIPGFELYVRQEPQNSAPPP